MSDSTGGARATTGVAPLWPLAVLLVLHVALWLMAGPGFQASDDLSYARAAHRMAEGTYVLADGSHWEHRLGVVCPTSLVFRLFGTGSWTAVIFPLLVSLTGIAGAYLFLRRRAPAVVTVAAALLIAAAPATLVQSTLLLPDNAVGIALMLAAFLTLAGRSERAGNRPALLGAAAALVVAYAVTVKLTTVWGAPPFVVLLVRDLLRRRRLRFWGAFTAVGALAGAAYLAMYHVGTGDALYRLGVIEAGHNRTQWALHGADSAAFVHRLLVEPFELLLRTPEFAGLVAFALPTAFACFAAPRRMPRRSVLFTALAATLLCLFFWGSTSFQRFAPMPLLPRMLVPVAPALAVLAAARFPHAIRAAWLGRWVGVALLAGATSYAVAHGQLLRAVVPAAMLTLALPPQLSRVGRLRPLGLGLVLLAATGYGVARGGIGEAPAQRAERRLPEVLAESVPGAARILTSSRGRKALLFRHGWDLPPRLTLETWEDREPPFPGVTHLLYVPRRPTEPSKAIGALLDAGDLVHEEAGLRLVRIPAR